MNSMSYLAYYANYWRLKIPRQEKAYAAKQV